MNSILQKMPADLSAHLNGLIKKEGFDTNEEDTSRFLDGWLKKRAFFDKLVEHHGFVLVSRIEEDFKHGILLFTYSGSLLMISEEKPDGTRDLIYNSIGMRQDHAQKVEDPMISPVFPIELNKAVEISGGKLQKTSLILAIAIEAESEPSGMNFKQRVRILGERISRSLIAVNQALFSKNTVTSELSERNDLFETWVILKWFQIGGWEEHLFLARAKMLFEELFSELYNHLSAKHSPEERDTLFEEIINHHFPKYCDDYKWLESERKDFDIGLMKALEEIPEQEAYQGFLKSFNN